MIFRALIILSFFSFINCETGKSELPPAILGYIALDYLILTDPDRSSVYFSTVRSLDLEVAYETDAEPFTGNFTIAGSNIWNVTDSNMQDVFADRGYSVAVTVPSDLSEMNEIPNQNRSTWSVNQLLDLVSKYRKRSSDYQSTSFFIVYVRGELADAPGVIAVTISGVLGIGPPVIFVFKDMIEQFDSIVSPDRVEKAEQMTVTHELGHALGLVNAGIPLYSSHQDKEHGNHCSNETCGMFWALSDSKVESFSPSSPLIFGQECRDDIRNYNP
ncbi:hypothetical protein [Leptospira neocaledonica]|uniref:Peptidase M43 pregnancy-associated plasma-A domain-containing protein n=1 Tax=Leptospira neocaledonica TaxID=2023192 RepID=A0A2M9ZTU9_9LEPT|nr:hypothetical protein [Leptospira neocaledonica]PJZ75528.1 hypothetical protein CH365_18600 [Leptospira neocaledonica]